MTRSPAFPVLVVSTLMTFSAPALAQAPLRLSGAAARADAQARLEALNANLLAHHSATAVLQAWCDAQGPTPAARILARRVAGADKPADARVRALLQARPDEPVGYRRVQLACGDQVLSEADNWYRPGRLTPEMNRVLDQTQTPFGVAVAALGFSRRNLSARLLFEPGTGTGAIVVPDAVLEQSAVLVTRDGQPLSLVVETYTREVLRRRGE